MKGQNPLFDPAVVDQAHQYAEQKSIDYQRTEQLNQEVSGVAGGTVFAVLLLLAIIAAIVVASRKSRDDE